MSTIPRQIACLAAAAVILVASVAQQVSAEPASASLDRVFAQFGASTPGCAVGVDYGPGRSLLAGYGAADLGHGIDNRPTNVF